MMSSPLVSTGWLEDHLDDPDLSILEIGSSPDDKLYREGHVPGAAWVYWKAACWHPTDREFVTPQAMARMFGANYCAGEFRSHRHRPPVTCSRHT